MKNKGKGKGKYITAGHKGNDKKQYHQGPQDHELHEQGRGQDKVGTKSVMNVLNECVYILERMSVLVLASSPPHHDERVRTRLPHQR